MSQKVFILLISFSVVIAVAVLTLFANKDSIQKVNKSELETAVNQAKYIYSLRKQQAVDFSKGPCLSDALLPGWVLDIAHNPRQAIDDLPENQCPAYRENRAVHFVELDPEGNLIRAK